MLICTLLLLSSLDGDAGGTSGLASTYTELDSIGCDGAASVIKNWSVISLVSLASSSQAMNGYLC